MSRPLYGKNKKAVKIPEALHGFTLYKRNQRRKFLPVKFHHHQLLSINILIIILTHHSRILSSYSNKIFFCQPIFIYLIIAFVTERLKRQRYLNQRSIAAAAFLLLQGTGTAGIQINKIAVLLTPDILPALFLLR
jgi:hypothetical protein